MVEVRQDVPGEQVTLGGVRVAGQDERLHAEAGVAAELAENLAGATAVVSEEMTARMGMGPVSAEMLAYFVEARPARG